MRKLIPFLLVTSFLFSCSNKDAAPGAINYNAYKVKTVLHRANGVNDTTTYNYSGNNLTATIRYSNNPGTLLTTVYTKGAGFYSFENFTGPTKSLDGYIRLLASGFSDSTASIRTNGTVNYISKYEYDANGYNTRSVTNYVTYENDYRMYYNGGNYSYWTNNFQNFSNPSQNRQDSIVFEFFTDKPQHIFYRSALLELYGKPLKNLVKKRTYYSRFSNTVYQTWEYEYETDAAGLVTREIWSVYTQPGNVLNRRDTTHYTYTTQ